MRNVAHAVDVLREMIGLPSLDFNEHGLFELVFDGAVSIDVVRVSEVEVELSAPISALDGHLIAERLGQLLRANYQGHATGGGRLAVDPRRDAVVYCQRLDVTLLEAHQMEQAFLTFLKYTLYWQGPGAEAVAAIQPAEDGAPPGNRRRSSDVSSPVTPR